MDSRLVEKQVLYAGTKVHLELHHLRDADDRKYKREVVVHPGAAVILPVLPDGRIILIKTFRYAVREHLLELPAGTIDPGETPINCAGRELMEETGYVAGKLTRLASFYSSPGVLTEKMHAYVATDLLPHAGEKDPGEEIELQPMTYEEAMNAALNGDIIDGKTLTTLLLYDARRKAGR
ncbi:MAG TPA: NUDIX hydrolase [Tepidisphaeraceae bacterium]|jgi:ADP-ribose pyrophosphatase